MNILKDFKNENEKLAQILIESMYIDPMYKYIFPDIEKNHFYFKRFWIAIIKYTKKYGYVIKSDDENGVMCLLKPNKTDFSLFDLIQTKFEIPRSILCFPIKEMTITMNIMMTLGQYQNSIINSPHWYLMSLGVKPEEQGKGIGKQILNKMVDLIELDKKPIYLETETEKNVNIYMKYGFEVVSIKTIANYGLKYYLMIKK